MMDIKVQHEDPSIQTSPLLTVPVMVIPKTSIVPATTIPPPIPPFIPLPQQSTPIPTPTTTEAKTSTTVVPDSETLSAIHLRVSDLEKYVKELKNVDHSLALLATIKSEVSTTVNEYLGTSMDDVLYKHKALYHALMESILENEDAIDKDVAHKSKKRKPDDVDRDEGPHVGSNQGLTRKNTSKDAELSKKAKPTKTSKGTTKSQPKSTNKSAQANEIVF
ncbi:hypothetical protein Tco_0884598 [Tanacetum coccineum]